MQRIIACNGLILIDYTDLSVKHNVYCHTVFLFVILLVLLSYAASNQYFISKFLRKFVEDSFSKTNCGLVSLKYIDIEL